jgi:hypothetical protein
MYLERRDYPERIFISFEWEWNMYLGRRETPERVWISFEKKRRRMASFPRYTLLIPLLFSSSFFFKYDQNISGALFLPQYILYSLFNFY